jgi:predicted ABC-type ATPase
MTSPLTVDPELEDRREGLFMVDVYEPDDAWLYRLANPFHDQKGKFTFRPGGRGVGAGLGNVRLTDSDVELMSNGSAASHLVKQPDGSYAFSPERQALHDEIIAKAMEGKQRVENPVFNVLGGGPATGKTNIVNSEMGAHLRDSNTTLMTNSDLMKEQLPEYAQMVADKNPAASAYVHEESSYLARRLQQAGFERGCNVTLDGTGDSSPSKLQATLANARAHGYSVHGTYVDVSVDTAIARAHSRGQRTGRFVPESVIRNTHSAVATSVRENYRTFDSLSVFNTDAGGTPEKIFTWDGTSATLDNQTKWREFMSKADAPPWRWEQPREPAGISFGGRRAS